MKKSTLVLVIVLVLLIGALYLVSQREAKVDPSGFRALFDIDSTQVGAIRIVAAHDSIALQKRGGQWFLTQPIEYPAEQRYVEELIGNASGLRVESLVSDKPEKHAKFEVDTSGTEVTISAGDRSHVFIVGKASSDYRHSYVRKKDGKEVYLVKETIKRYYDRRANEWRDRTIFDFDKDTVNRLVTHTDEGKTSFARADTGWVVRAGEDSFAADDNAVDRLLSSLCNLRASDFGDMDMQSEAGEEREAQAQGEPDFSKPEIRVEIGFDSGAFAALSAVPEGEQKYRYFVKKDGDDTVFIVYKSTLRQMVKKPEEFRKAPPEAGPES